MHIIGWIVFGLVVGLVAKFLMPGRDPGGFVITAVIGIVGAVLGGFGSPQGAVAGGITLGLLEAFGGAFLSTGYQDVVALVVLVVVLMLRPGGIFGTRVLE